MTTTPKPTAAEFDPPPNLTPMVRQILDLTAQLAESERARAKLRAAFRELIVECEVPGSTFALHLAKKALSDDALADQTTARESAENTAEETMTQQSQPCPPDCEGCKRPAQTPEPVEPSDEELEGIYDQAHTEGGGGCGLHAIAAHAAARRALYRAGLAAEAANHAAELTAWKDIAAAYKPTVEGLMAELERVRAENAMRERALCEKLDRRLADLDKARKPLTLDREALEAAFREVIDEYGCNVEIDGHLTDAVLRQLRAQARARRVPTREQLQDAFIGARDEWTNDDADTRSAVDMYIDAVLRLFAEAPPLDEAAVVEAMRHALSWSLLRSLDDGEVWTMLARAAMTALGFADQAECASPHHDGAVFSGKPCRTCGGDKLKHIGPDEAPAQPSPLVTSDNEPPSPLPEVLPAGTGSMLEGGLGRIKSRGEVRLKPYLGSRYYFGLWSCAQETCRPPESIDWSHYRAQQGAAEPKFPSIDDVRAAVKYTPTVGERAVSQPGGFLDALTRRVEGLELQGRVMRRAMTEPREFSLKRERVESTAEALARIEREERSK